MGDTLCESVAALLPDAAALLRDLIAIPSLSGEEEPAILRAREAFAAIGGLDTELAPIPPSIREDPDYSFPEAGYRYEGRHNLYIRRRGSGSGRSAILCTHLDVVPAGEWEEAFAPREADGVVYGRGACDCKGQAATLWLALAALERAGVRLCGDVTAQLVVEEEIGGNGALAALLGGARANAVVVLEPTGLNIHPACRGACWFRITLHGQSVHMGRKQVGVSAFEKAVLVYNALEEYERDLVAASRNQPLFEKYEAPVQVNVGLVRAGEWPSMVPGACVVEGGVGFLPNRPMRVIQDDLRALLANHPDPWIARHATVEFPKLHNDAYACDPEDAAVQSLAAACREAGFAPEVCGWNVSCDARLYALRGGMPTVVFGPGDVSDAHSDHESIRLADIALGAEALARWIAEG